MESSRSRPGSQSRMSSMEADVSPKRGPLASSRQNLDQLSVQDLPVDLRDWTVKDCGNWIRSLNAKMERVASMFETEGIDGEMLLELNDEILTEMGISSTLYRRKILSNLEKVQKQRPDERGRRAPERTGRASSAELDKKGARRDPASPLKDPGRGSAPVRNRARIRTHADDARVSSVATHTPSRAATVSNLLTHKTPARKRKPMTNREKFAELQNRVRHLEHTLRQYQAGNDAYQIAEDYKTENGLLTQEITKLRSKVEQYESGGLTTQKQADELVKQEEELFGAKHELAELKLALATAQATSQAQKTDIENLNFNLEAAIQTQQELVDENQSLYSKYALLEKNQNENHQVMEANQNMREELKILQDNMQPLIDQITDRDVKLEQKDREYTELYHMSTQLIEEVDNLKKQNEVLMTEIAGDDEGNAETEALNRQLCSLQEELHKKDDEILMLNTTLNAKDQALQTEKEQAKAFEGASVSSDELDKLREQLAEIKEERDELKEDFDDVKVDLKSTQECLDAERNSQFEAQNQIEGLQSQIESLQKQLSALKKAASASEDAGEDLALANNRLAQMKSRNQVLEAENQELMSKMTSFMSSQNQNALAAQELEQQTNKLIHERDSAYQQRDDMTEELQELRRKMKQEMRTRIEAEEEAEELRIRVAAASKNRTDGDLELEELRSTVARMSKLNNQAANDADEFESRLEEQLLKLRKSEARKSELEEEVEEMSLAKSKMQRQLREANENIEQLRETMETAKLSEQSGANVQISKLTQLKTSLERENESLKEENSSMLNQLQDLEKKVRHLTLEETRATSEAQELKIAFEKMTGNQSSVQTELAMLKVQHQKLVQNYAETKMECEEYKSEVDELQAAVTEFESKNAELLEELEKAQNELNMMDENHELKSEVENELLGDIEHLNEQLTEAKASLEELQAKNEAMVKELEDMKALKLQFENTDWGRVAAANEQMKSQIDYGKDKLAELTGKIGQLTNTNKMIKRDLHDAQGTISRLRDDHEELEDDLSTMTEKYMKAMQLAMEQEEKLESMQDGPPEKGSKSASRLKKQMKRAQQEQRRLEEEYSFLKEDVQVAHNHLKDFADLISEYDHIFDETPGDPDMAEFLNDLTALRNIFVGELQQTQEDSCSEDEIEFELKEDDDDLDIDEMNIKGILEDVSSLDQDPPSRLKSPDEVKRSRLDSMHI